MKLTLEQKYQLLKNFIEEFNKLPSYQYNSEDDYNADCDNREAIEVLSSFKERAWHILAEVTE